jgi:cysteine desulfurase/selenocysteine lyase
MAHSKKTKLVAAVHVSNALGTCNDIETIIQAARAVDARVLIDAAQSAPHQKIDVKKINSDFLVFSGHKMLGPTGIGILYIKKELHDQINPYQFGGGMIYEAN